MSRLPLSAVIPAYNREALVGRALDSIARQRRWQPAEVIVVDDGSSDRTAEVAEQHGAKVVRHEQNRGLPAARNTCFQAASQPWLALLDSDDEWLPHLLETLWPLRNGHVLVSGAGYGLAEDPARDFIGGSPTRRPVILDSPVPLIAYGNFIGPSSVLLSRDVVESVGGANESLARLGEAEDVDLWIRMLEQGTGVLVPQVVTRYHLFGEGAAGVQQDRALMQAGMEKVASSYRERPWCSAALLERLRGIGEWDELRRAQREGRHGDALRRVWNIVRHPWRLRGAVGIVLRRRRAGRRRWAVSREGLPTAMVLPGPDAQRVHESARARGYAVVDLGASKGSLAALWELLRRPTTAAYAGSALQALVVRGLGIRVLPADGPLEPQDSAAREAPTARR